MRWGVPVAPAIFTRQVLHHDEGAKDSGSAASEATGWGRRRFLAASGLSAATSLPKSGPSLVSPPR
jgi:hypothetical protein